MKLSAIKDLLSADVIFGEDMLDSINVETAFASDLLSDVLAYSKENALYYGAHQPAGHTYGGSPRPGWRPVREGQGAADGNCGACKTKGHSPSPNEVHYVRIVRQAVYRRRQGVPNNGRLTAA